MEGGERTVLESIDWSVVSIGILIVEMRYNDAANNRAIFKLLGDANFELVRSLPVWHEKIIDNVFVRAEHFLKPVRVSSLTGNDTIEVPPAMGEMLQALPRNVPAGANRRLLHGKYCCAPYTVAEPYSMSACAASEALGPVQDC